jgi:hypothetical protein
MSLLDTASLVVTPNGTKASKLYSVVPSDGAGDLDVTRATTATRVNLSGLIESVASNVPRLDYSNGECPSILVEPQRTNLSRYSEEFNNVAWTGISFNATVTANDTISPDGTMTADKVVFGTSGYLYQEYIVAGLSSATCSIYSKTSTQKIVFGGATPAGTDVYSFVDAGNGWYRQILTRTFTSGGTGVVQFLPIGTNETLYFWGAQLEEGSYATSYIPTTSASVTRNADVISKTGISSLIGQTEGTIYGELEIISAKADDSNLCIIRNPAGGDYDDIFFIRSTNGLPFASVRQGGTTFVSIGGSTVLTQGFHKFAFAYKQNDFAFYVDGNLIGTDTSGNVPTCSEVYLGRYIDGVDREVSKKSFALWKTRLTNTQLATLTTI